MANKLQVIQFLNLPVKTMNLDVIRAFMTDKNPKRINFASHHKHALKKEEQSERRKITLPFSDCIQPILGEELGTSKRLYSSPYGGVWRGIYLDEEYAEFEEFINKYRDIVFLRDHLDLSISLSMNYIDDVRTVIGELEFQAKFCSNKGAENALKEKCNEWIHKLPFYKHADSICAMPGDNVDEAKLPKRIVNSLVGFNFTDISDKVYWLSKNRESKEAKSMDEKLEILEESKLYIAEDLNIKEKVIILFDDLYMSGLSMQYVAMKLKEAGASRVLGLSIVKSRSNTAR